jgi:hypothetical protein
MYLLGGNQFLKLPLKFQFHLDISSELTKSFMILWAINPFPNTQLKKLQ